MTMENTALAPKLEEISNDAKKLLAQMDNLQVTTQEEFETAAGLLSVISGRVKRIDEIRTSFVKPLNDHVKTINNSFKAQSEPLKKAHEKLKTLCANYVREQEKIRAAQAAELARQQEEAMKKAEEAKKRLEEAATAEEIEAAEKVIAESNATQTQVVEAVDTTVRTAAGTVGTRKVWTYKVYDVDALMKAHPEFFVADSVKINEYVKRNQVESRKDGLEIYQDIQMTNRR